jgi:hypothetical protein
LNSTSKCYRYCLCRMCDEADYAMVSLFCSFWLLL